MLKPLLITQLSIILLISLSTTHANQRTESISSVEMGDGQINGLKLSPYRLTWSQCQKSEGKWLLLPSLTEEIQAVGKDLLRIRHWSSQADGKQVESSLYYNRESLAPIFSEQRVLLPSGDQAAHISHTLTEQGHTATIRQNKEVRSKEGLINSDMYDGMTLGLALTSLDYQRSNYQFNSAMLSMQGTYKTVATRFDMHEIEFAGEKVGVELVDVEWLHNESGDVYQPGPDGSGGRYWLVKNPPAGLPHVLRYQTDSYAIEFLEEVCPPAAE